MFFMKKIISYNVNGIRAALKKGFADWLSDHQVDIVCIQEAKAQPSQIDTALFEKTDYHTFSYSAQKKGYSGVATLTKTKPQHVEYGMKISKYDNEGRLLRLDFPEFSIINVYHPSGSSGDLRQAFKMQWLDDFYIYINKLKKDLPNLIISGDFNICHKPIDINHPERHKKTSGFLPEEREWMSRFIESGFIDSFRLFHSEPERYSWWSYRAGARQKNLGWRIDYNMVSENLKTKITSADLLSNVYHSDHCPAELELDF